MLLSYACLWVHSLTLELGLFFRAIGNTGLSCSYITNTSIHPNCSPGIINWWTEQNRTASRVFSLRGKKKTVSENVSNRASSPLASTVSIWETDKCQGLHHELLAFPKLREPDTPVSPPKDNEDKKHKDSQRQRNCHLQCITFAK